MRAIIIGAGRGRRLKALTDNQPKCYAPIGRRRILDWLLESLDGAGLCEPSRPVFIGGYLIDAIRKEYPDLTFCHNTDWPNNNILVSLFYAEPYMEHGFVCSYSDVLYRDTVVRRALEHPGDIVLCVDTDWRNRYVHRSQHPEDDAEKIISNGDRITRIDRAIRADNAVGEYIGVAKFTAVGAAALCHHYHRACRQYSQEPWRQDAVFEKAYLIDLYQDMIESGLDFRMVTTKGDYMEVDTEEDYTLANHHWPRIFSEPLPRTTDGYRTR